MASQSGPQLKLCVKLAKVACQGFCVLAAVTLLLNTNHHHHHRYVVTVSDFIQV